MGKEEIKQLDASAKSYARLKNEVIYLRFIYSLGDTRKQRSQRLR